MRWWSKSAKVGPKRNPAGYPFPLSDLLTKRRDINEAFIRSECAAVSVDPSTSVCKVLGRYKMFVDNADLAVSIHLMLDGYWEMWLTEALTAVVKPGMVVADIGANVGYFSLLMGDLVGPAGRVAAFEPIPHVANLLRRSLLVNGQSARTTIYTEPLSNENGTPTHLYFNTEQPGGAFTSISIVENHDRCVELLTRRLDSYPELAGVQVIKMDVEGSEERVWNGMTGILEKGCLEAIFMEWSATRYGDPRAFLAKMTSAGFDLEVLDPDMGIRPTNPDELLAAPAVFEWMVVLRRKGNGFAR